MVHPATNSWYQPLFWIPGSEHQEIQLSDSSRSCTSSAIRKLMEVKFRAFSNFALNKQDSKKPIFWPPPKNGPWRQAPFSEHVTISNQFTEISQTHLIPCSQMFHSELPRPAPFRPCHTECLLRDNCRNQKPCRFWRARHFFYRFGPKKHLFLNIEKTKKSQKSRFCPKKTPDFIDFSTPWKNSRKQHLLRGDFVGVKRMISNHSWKLIQLPIRHSKTMSKSPTISQCRLVSCYRTMGRCHKNQKCCQMTPL